MRRASYGHAGPLCLGIVLWAAVASAQTTGAQVTFASDPSWSVYAADPAAAGSAPLGFAQRFCLNFSSPQSCPKGATIYGNPAGGGWTADLSSIPGASWIWAPGVAGSTAKADLQFYYFTKSLQLPGPPLDAWISVAVDDYAIVYVNGLYIGEWGSIQSASQALAAQSALKTFDIGPALHAGSNIITVFAQNGPNTFNGCQACRYSQNSAGVVFGGAVRYRPYLSPAMLGFSGPWSGFDTGEVRPQPLSGNVPKTLVNTANGNHILRYRDLILPGDGLRFNFMRFYNSMDVYSGPLGPGWTHAYNLFLRLGALGVVLKEADGREVSYAPVSNGDYKAVTLGVFDTLHQNADGSFVLTRKDHNRLLFSATGQLTNIFDQNGRFLTCEYEAGNLVRIIDPEGHVFSLRYDANNHLISLTDPFDRVLRYGYDEFGRLISSSDPEGGQTLYSYGPTGQLKAATQPGGSALDSFLNLYDSQGRVIVQQNPAESGTTASYNVSSGSTATTFVDALGRKTTHVYDSQSRLIQIIDAMGGITTYGYDAYGNRNSITDPLNNLTTLTYDLRGNVLSIKDGEGAVSRFVYDANNNLLSSTNGRGVTITYQYDSQTNNRISQQDVYGDTTLFSYDGRGHVTQIQDPNLGITYFTWDVDELTAVKDALTHVTRYVYDTRGNRITMINARQKTTSYDYDALDRLICVSEPGGQITRYGYDELGNLESMIDAAGRETQYFYSGLNKLVKVKYPTGAEVQYGYDAVGNRTSMSDSRGTTSFRYDDLDRLISVIQPGGKTVKYSYDAGGNRKSVQYPDGRKVTYSYDRVNRMTRATDWLGRTTQYGYDAAGNVTSLIYPNRTRSTFAFDDADRLVSVSNSFQGSDQNSIPLTRFQYVLDPAGNRLQATDGTGQSTFYQYDALGQLVKQSLGSDAAIYSYDEAGNRTSVQSKRSSIAYGYDDGDRLLTAGDAVFTYDMLGNRISRTSGGVLTTYAYDDANRLTAVNSGGVLNTFEYDGDGNRVAQNVAGAGRYDYVNDVAGRLTMVLQESGPDGAISYVRGRGLISATGPAFDYFYLTDALRSTVGLTDAVGNRTQRYVYDAWGANALSLPSPGVGTRNKFRFTGEALDPGTGLYYLRARYYEPDTGRFLSKDRRFGSPLVPLSFNPYIYVRNNPLRYVDPSGCDYEPPEDPPEDEGEWPFSPPWP